MNIRLQMVVALIIILGLFYIIKKTKIHQVDLKYALIWFFVGIIYLLFDLIPQLQSFVTDVLGISTPVTMLVFLAIGFIFAIIFTLTVIVSTQTSKIRRLIQEIGIMEKEIEILKKQINNR
jgi:hypothetical protein